MKTPPTVAAVGAQDPAPSAPPRRGARATPSGPTDGTRTDAGPQAAQAAAPAPPLAAAWDPPPAFATAAQALARGLVGRRGLVVATSGGPDSQALLHWSVAQARLLGVAHLGGVGIDHGLRPAAAKELDLAEAECRRLGVGFVRVHLGALGPGNTLQQARLHRRRALRRAARRLGADVVLLGHTADDQAETLLQHLGRGAGLAGACAMPLARGKRVRWLRPWLGLGRQEVMAYVGAWRLPYAVDPSNADLRRARARLRAEVLPALERLYPGACGRLSAFAAEARQVERYLRAQTRRLLARCARPHGRLALAALLAGPPALQGRALRAWLQTGGADVDRRTTVALLRRLRALEPSQRLRVAVPGGLLAVEGGKLTLGPMPPRRISGKDVRAGRAPRLDAPPAPEAAPVVLADGTQVRWGPFRIAAHLVGLPVGATHLPFVDRSGLLVAFAADSPHVCLSLRSWREGDRLYPFGLGGSVSVGDLFTNAKVPRAHRLGWPIVTLHGEVAWVVGVRRGCQAPVDGATGRAWVVRAERVDL